MASIRTRARSDGTLAYAVLYRLDSRQCALTFQSEPAAVAFAAAVDAHGPKRALEMHDIDAAPRWEGKAREPLTVAGWARRHIDALTGVEQYTLDKYEEYLRVDIEGRALGSIPLSKLQESDIAAWVESLAVGGSGRRSRPNGPKTIANKHGFLSAALNTAVKAGHIPSNPAAGRRLPKRKATEDHEMRMLTAVEFANLRAATVPSWRPMLGFMVA